MASPGKWNINAMNTAKTANKTSFLVFIIRSLILRPTPEKPGLVYMIREVPYIPPLPRKRGGTGRTDSLSTERRDPKTHGWARHIA
jgi:hypothetical protein